MPLSELARALGKANGDSVLAASGFGRAADGAIAPWCLRCSQSDPRPTFLGLAGRAFTPWAKQASVKGDVWPPPGSASAAVHVKMAGETTKSSEPSRPCATESEFRAAWAGFLCEVWAPAAQRAGIPRADVITFSGGLIEAFPKLMDGLREARGGAIIADVLAPGGQMCVGPPDAGLLGGACAARLFFGFAAAPISAVCV